MKNYINVPVGMCEFACAQDKLQEFSVYVCLQQCTNGIVSLRNAYQLIRTLPGLSSNPSIRKAINELVKMDWIGVDRKKEGSMYVASGMFAKV